MPRATRKCPLGCSHCYLPASILGTASDILVYIRLFSDLGLGERYPSIYTERLLKTLASDLGVKDVQGTYVSALESLCQCLGAVILSAPHSASLWQGVQAWTLSLAQV